MDLNTFHYIVWILFCSARSSEDIGSAWPSLRNYDQSTEPRKVAFPIKGANNAPSWLVLAGRKVIPGSVYHVTAEAIKSGNPNKKKSPIQFQSSLLWNGHQVSFGEALVIPGNLSKMLLKVPSSSLNGTWKLLVEGKESKSQLHIFKKITVLEFFCSLLTILIQTSRPIYNAGQTVRFRAVLLNRDLKGHEDPVNVYVTDPRNLVMRRWPSQLPEHGVVSLQFDLPRYPLTGNWTILIQAGEQIQKKKILVEQYFRPLFEVFVRLPLTFRSEDKWIEGVVIANMTNWRSVYGNCTVKLQLAMDDAYPVPTKYRTIKKIFIDNFTGVYHIRAPVSSITNVIAISTYVIARLYASVGDAFSWQIQHGWALTKIFRETVLLRYLGDKPFFFKPGMPFLVHVFTTHSDNHLLSKEELMNATLSVSFRAAQEKVQMAFDGKQIHENSGAIEAVFEVPDEAEILEIYAKFVSSTGLTSSLGTYAYKSHSPREHHLQVDTSTKNAKPGEFIILHVRNNFFVSHFNYIVVANGIVVHSDRLPVTEVSVPTITTFSLPASSKMAPVAKILVWVVDNKGEIVSHSLAIPVDPLSRHQVTVRWNKRKDHTAEVEMIGETGSLYATSGIWEETYKLDAGHDLNDARILSHMAGYDDDADRYADLYNIIINAKKAVITRTTLGFTSQVRLFSYSNTGPDVPTTMNFAEVILLTDASVFYHPSKASEAAQCRTSFYPCLTGSCFHLTQRCNGIPDCSDASDESGCPQILDSDKHFRLYRMSRLHRFYDPDIGDWGWKNIKREEREISTFRFPKRPQNWIFSMFAIGTGRGFGVMKNNIQFDSAGTFILNLEGPRVARFGEQIGLTVGLFNFNYSTVCALVTLPHSPFYRIVKVEDKGVVDSFSTRSSQRTMQHVLWLPGNGSTDVHFPIVFLKMGKSEVKVEGSTPLHSDSQTLIIEVIAEGAIINKHTSILLDLKNTEPVYEFFDIHLDESPFISYSQERKYIYGTPQGHVSITGDVIGPVLPEIPGSTERFLDKSVMGAETLVYNFAVNIWCLQYLRLTSQLTDDTLYKVMEAVHVDYASLSRYQTESGGFSNWINSEPSVWLTAHVLKNLLLANFQDWKNYIYIDPRIIWKSIVWILDYQTMLGSFSETEHYLNPLDPKTDPRSRHAWMVKYNNVSLTAHVVIALCDVVSSLNGTLRKQVTISKRYAVSYLEKILESLDDAYDLAVVSLALTRANTDAKDLAFSKLRRTKRINGNMIYWSREPIAFNNIVYENNQRPYLQPKEDTKWDAHAVETTSYALMVYVKREGIGIIQENIVRFLASMREADGGMISTLDSLVAMEALVMYSCRAKIRDITDMEVSVELSSTSRQKISIAIRNSSNLAQLRTFYIKDVYGHLSVIGRGSGQALVQLDYSYGVDVESELDVPPVPSFDFQLTARYSGRNKSYITINSCQRWINVNETPTSGLTVVAIHLPTGYYIMQNTLLEIVWARRVKNLRWALITDTQILFFFNKLDHEMVCFSYRLERWFPVSNHSRYNKAIVYEFYQPERFNMKLFEVFPLHTLDICEVCGSYQCPHCPFYSTGPELMQYAELNILSVVLILCIFNKINFLLIS